MENKIDEELREVLEGIDALKDSEVYKKINDVARSKYQQVEEKQTLDRIKYNTRNPRRLLEETLLKKGVLNNFFSKDAIVYRNVELTNGLITILYLIYSGEKPSMDIVKKSDRIYELTLNHLENFDNKINKPEITRQLYEKSKKLTMSKDAKKTRKKIREKINKIDVKYVGFTSENGAFTQSPNTLFSAVSAVHAGREVILPEDVIRSYRTILKLINTDLSKIPLPPDKTDEEINQELDSLGSYKGKTYRQIADELYQAALKEHNLEET